MITAILIYDPDLILHNARVATLNAARPRVEAVATQDGKFVAAGTDAEVLKLRGDHTRVIDAGGRTVIPGLNDSHLHLIRGGLKLPQRPQPPHGFLGPHKVHPPVWPRRLVHDAGRRGAGALRVLPQ
jgi:cytosine/adenosine deaminase-related metal-dependent hydrolase